MRVNGVITVGKRAGEISEEERGKLERRWQNKFSGSKMEMNVMSSGVREDAGVAVVSSTMSKRKPSG